MSRCCSLHNGTIGVYLRRNARLAAVPGESSTSTSPCMQRPCKPAEHDTHWSHTSACAAAGVKRPEDAKYTLDEACDEAWCACRRLRKHVRTWSLAPDVCSDLLKLENATAPLTSCLRQTILSSERNHMTARHRGQRDPTATAGPNCVASCPTIRMRRSLHVLKQTFTTHQYGVIDRSTLGSFAYLLA